MLYEKIKRIFDMHKKIEFSNVFLGVVRECLLSEKITEAIKSGNKGKRNDLYYQYGINASGILSYTANVFTDNKYTRMFSVATTGWAFVELFKEKEGKLTQPEIANAMATGIQAAAIAISVYLWWAAPGRFIVLPSIVARFNMDIL